MDVVLVSARARSPLDAERRHPRRDAAEALARALAAAGHRVRHLIPESPLDPAAQLGSSRDGEVAQLRTATPFPPFDDLQEWLYDVPLERALAPWLRRDPPDVVHVDGFGGASSHLTPWLALRLGVPSLVVATPFAELLCHRGTLIHASGSRCETWDDPARCYACCTTPRRGPTEEGLGRSAAFWARVTRSFGPLSRPPRPADFENRLDMVVHGLDNADVIVFGEQWEREALAALALPMRGVEVGIPAADDLDAWLSLYRRAVELATGA